MEVVPVAEKPALSRKKSRRKMVGSEVDRMRNARLNRFLIRCYRLRRVIT